MLRTLCLLMAIGLAAGPAAIAQSWTPLNSSTTTHLHGASFHSPSNMVAVGEGGMSYTSSDTGGSWTAVNGGNSSLLRGVSFWSSTEGMAVGQGLTLARTTNNGASWTLLQDDYLADYHDIFMMQGAPVGSVAGVDSINQCLVETTSDGGDNWGFETFYWDVGGVSNEGQVLDVWMVSASLIYVAGRTWTGQAAVAVSNDGGSTFTTLYVGGGTDALRGIAFADDQQGIVVGEAGVILYSSDGGASWQTPSSNPAIATLNDVWFAADGQQAWAVGEGGTILYSGDGGINWTAQTSNSTATLRDLSFFDANNGLAVGDNGTALRYQNDGALPNRAPLPFELISPDNMELVERHSAPLLWQQAVDLDGDTLEYLVHLEVASTSYETTVSTGDSSLVFDFSQADLPEQVLAVLWNVSATDGQDTTACLNAPGIFQISEYNSVPRRAPGLPRQVALHPPQPNPFNSSTTLRFELPQRMAHRLALYDMLGREVVLLSHGEGYAGMHRLQLDGGGLASGVYLLRLEAEGQSWQQKLQLLK